VSSLESTASPTSTVLDRIPGSITSDTEPQSADAAQREILPAWHRRVDPLDG
jgi:hypothetical protein